MTHLLDGLSRTWQRRIKRLTLAGAVTALLVVLSGAVISDYATAKRFISPSTPVADIAAAAARDVLADTAPITAFAEHCVPAILMANASTNLGACNPHEHPYTFDPAATITTLAARAATYTIKYEGTAAGVAFYAAMVMVDVRANPGAQPDLEYFSIPIAVGQGTAPTAVDRITRVDPPPQGPAVGLDYGSQIKEGTEIHRVLAGFVNALLADTGDLGRYTTTDSGITPIGGYARDTIKILATAAGDAPDAPAEGAELAAHIDVTASRAARTFTHSVSALTTGTEQLAYSVMLRSVGGTWFVASIDVIPQITPIEGKP